jgi:hypothetical protein
VPTSLAQVDELLEARDTQRGVRGSIHLEPEEVLGTAHEIGLVSIAFDELVASRVGLRALFERASVPGRLDFAPSPNVTIGNNAFPLLVTESPFPAGSYDAAMLGGPRDLGRSVITICAGPFSIRRDTAIISRGPEQSFDAWNGWGLRDATRLAVALARLGEAIIVHRSGDVAFPVDEWIRLTGDLDHEACRPFGAYVELGFTPDRSSLATRGMDVWALPDVIARAPRALEDDAEFAAARDACLVACSQMVHGMHALAAGSELWVRPGVEVGAYPLAQDPSIRIDGARCWRVDDAGEQVVLIAGGA